MDRDIAENMLAKRATIEATIHSWLVGRPEDALRRANWVGIVTIAAMSFVLANADKITPTHEWAKPFVVFSAAVVLASVACWPIVIGKATRQLNEIRRRDFAFQLQSANILYSPKLRSLQTEQDDGLFDVLPRLYELDDKNFKLTIDDANARMDKDGVHCRLWLSCQLWLLFAGFLALSILFAIKVLAV